MHYMKVIQLLQTFSSRTPIFRKNLFLCFNEIRLKNFYFILKALFVLEILKFLS